ncbi:hypothetical protein ACFUJY_24885 [Streptomyces sp. NPDC057249]|uniref:hypothetical protein n=1 Tax=Streptomyces sp. NPDC057249 TaxID=3346067 RepID=UPI003645480E
MSGSVSGWESQLRNLITGLHKSADGRTHDSTLPVEGRASSRILPELVRAGVLSRTEDGFLPTASALQWLESGDPCDLIGIFHRHVRFIGELMGALAEQPATHQELVDTARRFGLPWDSPSPVRDRTNWLRALGLADLFDGQVHLTATGQRIHPLLVPGNQEIDDEPSDLPTPPPAVAMLLERLNQQALQDRPHASVLYVPGRQDNDGRLEALRLLTEAVIPSITDNSFTALLQEAFPGIKTPSSAKSAREAAKALGLIRRDSSTSWAATEAGAAWVVSNEPLDLARIIQGHILYFAEILHELDNVTPATAAGLADRAHVYTPSGNRQLHATAVKARLDLLLACGLVAKSSWTTYRVTALGRAFRAATPCMSPLDSTVPPEAAVMPELKAAAAHGEALATEIESAAYESSSPERLERAVIAALSYLGMPGHHIGGQGHADGVVRIGVGVYRRVLTVEAKTSAKGRVVHQSLSRLPLHRAKVGADLTLLVGPGFDPRLQEEADDDPSIALVYTGTLGEAVRAQALTPLTPASLHPLIDPAMPADQRDDLLCQARQDQLRHAQLERVLLDILLIEAGDPLHEGAWLEVTDLRRELRTRGERVDADDVTSTLAFLASARLAVVERSSRGYRAIASAHTVLQRLEGLGRQWLHLGATPTQG